MRKREKEDEKKRLEAKRLKDVADHEERRAGVLFFPLKKKKKRLEAKRPTDLADHEERRAGALFLLLFFLL
jgi:hypothetical protein